MKRLLLAGAAAAILASAAAARAQTAGTRYVFVAVDAAEVESNKFKVTGVLEGEPSARTITVSFFTSSSSYPADRAACQQQALLAMTRPGQFRFEVQSNTAYASTACKLALVTP
jgi:hypothetical protein